MALRPIIGAQVVLVHLLELALCCRLHRLGEVRPSMTVKVSGSSSFALYRCGTSMPSFSYPEVSLWNFL